MSMSLPTPDSIEEIITQLWSIMDSKVGTSATAEIDNELLPDLKSLVILGPDSQKHPIFWQFVEWLTQPHRTVEQINYVVGPLSKKVWIESIDVGSLVGVGMAAAEALAIKSPILIGSWEHTTWLVLHNIDYKIYNMQLLHFLDSGTPSDRLTSWVIHVIGNANVCPNPYLRLEFTSFLLKAAKITKHNQIQANEAIMAACSVVSFDYLNGNYYGEFSKMNIENLVNIFDRVIDWKWIENFGTEFPKQFVNMNIERLSRARYGLSFDSYTEPMGFHSLIALSDTISDYLQSELEQLECDPYNYSRESSSKILSFSHDLFIFYISECFELPQLTYIGAKMFMNILELKLMLRAYFGPSWLVDLDDYLEGRGRVSNPTSFVRRELVSQNGKRLRNLKNRCYDIHYELIEYIEGIWRLLNDV